MSYKSKNTILLLFTSAFLFIMPDLLFKLFQTSSVIFRPGKILEVFIFSSIIMMINSNKLRRTFIILYGIFYSMELCHYAFFGDVATPYTYIWMFTELQDTASGIFNSLNLFYAPLCVILPFSVLLYLDIHYNNAVSRSRYGTIVFCLVVLFMAIDVNRPNRSFFYMGERNTNPTFINSLRKLPFIFFKAVPKIILGGEGKTFKEYTLTTIPSPEKINIIYIIGESANPDFMSLYGYKNKTTPFLDKFKNDKTFFYKKGYSSSVSTIYSIMMNFYMQREPENYQIQKDKKIDIIKLAKDSGFKVWYITTQSTDPEYEKFSDVSMNISSKIKTGEEVVVNFFPLLSELKDKNIIFYHQNIMHFDYKDHYSFNKDKWEVFKKSDDERNNQKIAEYNNSVLYWDYINSKIFNYAENISKQTMSPTYIIYMSDHGELIGGNKRGHSVLTKEVGTIPVFVKCYNCNQKEFELFSKIKTPTHYRINEKLLNLYGYELNNPNDDGKTFYINGKNLYGDDGFITLTDDNHNVVQK